VFIITLKLKNSMDFISKNNITWLSYFNNFQALAGVSTKTGGFSTGNYEGLNVGLNTADDKTIIQKNRELLFTTVAPQMEVIHINQTHSNIIHNTQDSSFKIFSDGDGLITTERNKLLCITLADCGSVVFHDEDFTVVCAIHCGWKGTQTGIIQAAINELLKHTELDKIHAYVGPMIRCSNYEVGKEFLGYFGSEHFKESNGKLFLDLNNVILTTLMRANIGSVIDCGIDTYLSPETFYSHRLNNTTGRMCAFIGLK